MDTFEELLANEVIRYKHRYEIVQQPTDLQQLITCIPFLSGVVYWSLLAGEVSGHPYVPARQIRYLPAVRRSIPGQKHNHVKDLRATRSEFGDRQEKYILTCCTSTTELILG